MQRHANHGKIILTAIILASVTPLSSSEMRVVLYLCLAIHLATRPRESTPDLASPFLLATGMMPGLLVDLTTPGGPPSLSALGVHALYFIGPLIGYLYMRQTTWRNFLDDALFVTRLLSAVSLLGVVVYTLLPGVISMLPTYHFYNTTHHTAFFHNFITASDGSSLARNAGVASEPGLFQFIPNLGLAALYLNWHTARLPYTSLVIFSAAVVTTRSTTGFIILSILLLAFALRSAKLLAGLALAALAASGPILEELAYQQESKLQGSALEARALPARAIVNIVTANPFGIGNTLYEHQYEDLSVGSYDSFTQTLIRYGIPLALILCLLLARLAFTAWPFAIVVAATFISQPIAFRAMVSIFYFASASLTRGNQFQDTERSNSASTQTPRSLE